MALFIALARRALHDSAFAKQHVRLPGTEPGTWGRHGRFTLSTIGARTAAIAAANRCNGTDDVGRHAVTCEVTSQTTSTSRPAVVTSTVTVEEWHGAANTGRPCVTMTTPGDSMTARGTQCDGSGSGGGGTVTCNVPIVNYIADEAGHRMSSRPREVEPGETAPTADEPQRLVSNKAQ
jgi:hypothetical protein